MIVLITGVAGFLGSHLALRHLNAGDFVIGVDNYSSSDCSSPHLNKIFKHNLQSCFNIDICDLNVKRFINIFRTLKVDLIYNFACPASPPIYQSMPVQTMMTCTLGVKNILDIAMNDGSRVIHASTSEVYGDPSVSPQPESYRGYVNSYGIRSCYDEGKRAAEALCFDYLNSYNVDVRLVRIFNTYGPHMRPSDGRVISNFVRDAMLNKSLTVYGDGSQTRSFCYVDDLLDGVQALAKFPYNPKTPVNIGNPNEFTMLELVDVLKKVFNKDLSVEHQQLPQDDPTQRKPNISYARSLLNWEPKISLERGIELLRDYWIENKIVQ